MGNHFFVSLDMVILGMQLRRLRFDRYPLSTDKFRRVLDKGLAAFRRPHSHHLPLIGH
jgi:hypothetical protein